MLKNKILIFALFITCFGGPAFGQNNFTYDSKGKRNPFIPLVSKEGRLMKLDREEARRSDIYIDGIIYDKHGLSYAIVNGLVVGIGDYIGEFRVLRIEENKVVLLKGDQMREVAINKEGNK